MHILFGGKKNVHLIFIFTIILQSIAPAIRAGFSTRHIRHVPTGGLPKGAPISMSVCFLTLLLQGLYVVGTGQRGVYTHCGCSSHQDFV